MKRSDETEKTIIQIALYLFVRKGYHGTSINDIMRKTGLTKGALYYHFRSKSELLLRIIDKYKAQFLDKMIKSIEKHHGNAVQKLHHLIGFNARFALEHHNLCVFLTFLTTELNADVDFEPILKSVYRQYQKVITKLIEQGIKDGLLMKDLDPDLAALTFMALHDGLLHQWVLNRNYIDEEEYIKTYRKIFFSGILKREAS